MISDHQELIAAAGVNGVGVVLDIHGAHCAGVSSTRRSVRLGDLVMVVHVVARPRRTQTPAPPRSRPVTTAPKGAEVVGPVPFPAVEQLRFGHCGGAVMGGDADSGA